MTLAATWASGPTLAIDGATWRRPSRAAGAWGGRAGLVVACTRPSRWGSCSISVTSTTRVSASRRAPARRSCSTPARRSSASLGREPGRRPARPAPDRRRRAAARRLGILVGAADAAASRGRFPAVRARAAARAGPPADAAERRAAGGRAGRARWTGQEVRGSATRWCSRASVTSYAGRRGAGRAWWPLARAS